MPDTASGFPRSLLTSDERILLELKPSAIPFVLAPVLSFSIIIIAGLVFFAALAMESINAAVASCGIPLVIFAIILVISAYIGYLTWRNTYFAISDRRVLQKSGFIGMNAYDAPVTAIQNVTLLQPWLYRLFGIGTLVFATSGTGGGAAVSRATATRSLSNAMWLAGNIVFAGVRDPVATRKRVEEILQRATADLKEKEYRKMAETFKEVGTAPGATAVLAHATPPTPTVVAPPRHSPKFCEFCGTRLEPGATFCPKCGGRVT